MMFRSRKNPLASSEMFESEFRNLSRLYPSPIEEHNKL